jgi:hypothetical protein
MNLPFAGMTADHSRIGAARSPIPAAHVQLSGGAAWCNGGKRAYVQPSNEGTDHVAILDR